MEHFHPPRGFTLIEMLVVLAIIVIITTMTITSQSTFNKTLILKNTAYDIALSLRSAESFGIGSRATTLGATKVGYGIHFTKGNSFIVFADTSPATVSPCHGSSPSGVAGAPDELFGNCIYDGAGVDTPPVQTYTLGNGITVKDFCAFSDSWRCTSSGTPLLTSLDIVFARPDPTPFMSTNGSYSTSPKITKACITVASPVAPSGPYQYVTVEASGAITANATADPSSCH